MGNLSFLARVREWIGGIGFDVFLWSIRMSQDEYLDAVIRESGLAPRLDVPIVTMSAISSSAQHNVQLTGAWCPNCNLPPDEFGDCIRCGEPIASATNA